MHNCLIILNPREIPECLESLEALDIDKLWLTGFTENQLVDPLNDFVATTDYDNYLIASDDLIVTQQALETVETLLENHELATGYCRIADDSPFYNVTRRPIIPHGKSPCMADYGFYRTEEIDSLTEPEFVSWFGGWTLTGMRRELWLQHPFRVHPVTGFQSDYAVCLNVGRQFASHKDAYCRHLRKHTNGLDRTHFILGKVTPVMRHVQRYRQSSVEVPLDNSGILLSALSSSTVGGGPPPTPDEIRPVLHDRLFPDMWCPGIDLDSPQACNIVVALPMWERGGNIAHNYAGGKDGFFHEDVVFNVDDVAVASDPVFGITGYNAATPIDGTNSGFAIVPHDPSSVAEDSAAGWTASVFFYPVGDQDGTRHILSRTEYNPSNPNDWHIDVVDADEPFVYLETSWQLGGRTFQMAGPPISRNRWHHFAIVVRPDSAVGWIGEFYVNGVLDSSATFATAPVDSSADFMVGCGYDVASGTYTKAPSAKFMDARLYNRGLLAGEIWQIAHFPEELYRQPEAAGVKGIGSGVRGGGDAITSAIYSVEPTDGVELGGDAIAAAVYSVASSGGATLGGESEPSVSILVEGGAVAGGTADVNLLASETGSGGVVIAGTGNNGLDYTETPEGGVVSGGSSANAITAGGTAADSLQLWLTGANEDRGEQTDVDLSLGGYRSRSSAKRVGILEATAINGVSVLLGSRWNGTSGSLIATDGDSLSFASAGGTVGTSVSIADGEIKVVADGSDSSKFVRVQRTSVSDLQGQASLEFHDQIHNVISLANADDAEHQSGSDKYRAVMLRNETSLPISAGKVWIDPLSAETTTSVQQLSASGTGTIEGAADCFCGWPSKGWGRITDSGGTLREIVYYSARTDSTLTVADRARLGTTASAGAATDTIVAVPGIRIAFEASVSEAVQTIADEETAPTGLSWSTATDSANGVSITTLAMGDGGALWLHRELPADVAAHAKLFNSVRLQWTWNGVTYNERLNGIYRIADDDLDRYELHIGAGEAPDLSQPPDETFTSLPHTTSTPLDSSVKYHFVTNRRNKYDLVSETVITEITLDGDGSQQSARPATPEIVRWEATDSGAFLLEIVYFHQTDPVELQADSFQLYVTYNGVDPDLLTDTPVSVSIDEIDMVDSVVVKTYITASQDTGTIGKIIATTKRSSDGVESLPTAVESATVDDVAPSGDRIGGFYRSVAEQS